MYLDSKQLSKFIGKVGNNVFISDKATIINPKNLSIKDNVRVDDYVSLNCQKKLEIHSNIHIGQFTSIRAHEKIIIKDYALISSYVDIFTAIDNINDRNYFSHPMLEIKSKFFKDKRKKLVIDKYSFIGSHSVIVPEAEISEGVSVGALTLINFKTSKWTSYLGNPVRILGKRNKDLVKKNYKKK